MFSVFLFIIFNILALTYAQPSICYFCRTYIEGEGCNDPINTTAISMQHCTNFTLVQTPEPFGSKAHRYNSVRETIGGNSTVVCSKMTYVNNDNNGELVTLRSCEFALYEERDVCSFYREDITNNPVLNYTDFTCSVCHDDLCNSSPSLQIYVTILLNAVVLILFC